VGETGLKTKLMWLGGTLEVTVARHHFCRP
jgi:hypothetical protein